MENTKILHRQIREYLKDLTYTKQMGNLVIIILNKTKKGKKYCRLLGDEKTSPSFLRKAQLVHGSAKARFGESNTGFSFYMPDIHIVVHEFIRHEGRVD